MENINSSALILLLYVVIPLNPRTHPVKLFVVIPVYVKISSSILKRPYSFGNPFVDSTFTVVSVDDTALVVDVNPDITSGVKLLRFKLVRR